MSSNTISNKGSSTNPCYALQSLEMFWYLSFSNFYDCATQMFFKDLSLIYLSASTKKKNILICKWAVSLVSYTSYSAAAGGVQLG